MTITTILQPVPSFLAIDGTPLDDGFVYIGDAGGAAQASPKQVYWDAAATLPATQPIRTRGGFALNGSIRQAIYVQDDYSIRVLNKNGTEVYSATSNEFRLNSTVTGVPKTPYDFGAVGDGVADDTQAFISAADFGGNIRVPAGTFMVTPPIQFTKWNGWVIEEGATVKWLTAPSTDAATFEFRGGSDGSFIKGQGVIDGNRDALTYPVTSPALHGYRNYGIPDVTVTGITIQNTFLHAAFHGSGDRPIYRDQKHFDCGRGMGVQFCSSPTIENITQERIGNNGIAIFQHANAFRNFNGGRISNFRCIDYQPDTAGLEPNPHVIDIERSFNFTIDGVYIDGFEGSSPSGLHKGVKIDGSVGWTASGIQVVGYNSGIRLKGVSFCSLTDCSLDGQYVDETQGTGLEITTGGLYPNDFGGALNQNTRSISTCFDVTISNTYITGFYNGVTGQAQRAKFVNVSCIGSVRNNWNFTEEVNPADFDPDNLGTVTAPQITTSSELIGCTGRNAGRAGLQAVWMKDIRVIGGDWRNNGQDTTQGSNERSAFLFNGSANQRDGFIVSDADCRDTQNWSVSDLASFEPGTTDSNNEMSIVLLDPTYCDLGQFITLKNAIGSDVVGKVTYKYLDDIRVRFSSAQTFVDTGNLNALTGTASGSSGTTTITGVGTLFGTEIKGHVYVKIGPEYHRVAVVNSDTEITLATELASTYSGVSVEIVQIDVEGIPSQNRAIYANNDTVGVEFHNIQQSGNLIEPNEIAGVPYGEVDDSTNPIASGTYTATIEDDSGNASPTTVIGDWVRNGDICTVTFSGLENIDTTGMTPGDSLRIMLPFQGTSAEDERGILAIDNMASVAGGGNDLVPMSTGALNYARLFNISFTGGRVLQGVSNINSGSTNIYSFSLSYEVAWG